MTRDQRRGLADIRRAMKAYQDNPTHSTHPYTEPDECSVMVEGCPRCAAIAEIWINATDWIALLLQLVPR